MRHTYIEPRIILCVAMMLGVFTCSSEAFAILGGTYSEEDRGAYLLDIKTDDGEQAICSGVAISARLFLTAGHCVAVGFVGYEPEMRVITAPEREQAQDDEVFEVTGRYLHPEFDQSFIEGGFDLAILVVQRDFPTHVSLPEEPLSEDIRALRAVGYGISGDDVPARATGRRRTATLPIQKRDAETVQVGDDMRSACYGDSGGGLFDAHGTVVATLSHGPPGCMMGMTATLLAPHMDFIEQVLDHEARKQAAQTEPDAMAPPPPEDELMDTTCAHTSQVPAPTSPLFMWMIPGLIWWRQRRRRDSSFDSSMR